MIFIKSTALPEAQKEEILVPWVILKNWRNGLKKKKKGIKSTVRMGKAGKSTVLIVVFINETEDTRVTIQRRRTLCWDASRAALPVQCVQLACAVLAW